MATPEPTLTDNQALPPEEHAPYLTALEMLYEEYRATGGDVSALEGARKKYTETKAGGEEHAAAEREFRNALYAHFHASKRSALCFSGGGIRSATFGLGVLQGLARWSKPGEDGGRPGLLGEFDFLSTVSGGGYLGGWLSAWSARQERAAPDGFGHVIRSLAAQQESAFDPEPLPVRYLRQYSNYLSPKMGLLSGDTWALVATVARNMFLNWLVLLPLAATALLVPVLALQLTQINPAQVSTASQWFLLISAFVAGAIATGYLGFDLPSAGNARKGYHWYLGFCLAPLTYAAVQLTTFWAWLQAGNPNAPVWDFVGLGRTGLGLGHFVGFGAVMHGGGMLAGIAVARFHYDRPPKLKGLIASAAAMLTGAAAGAAGYSVTSLVRYKMDGLLQNPVLYVCLAFPTVMGLFMGASALLVGGTSYITEDQDREWWSRSGGWFLLLAIAWPVLAALVLYSDRVLDWASMEFTGLFTGATGLTGWAASRLGHSDKTPANHKGEGARGGGESEGGGGSSMALQLLAKIMLPAFLCLLTFLLAALNQTLTRFLAQRLPSMPSLWPPMLKPMGDATAHTLWLVLLYAVICLTASYFINVNKFSLHAMYRQRLIRAYLGASNTDRSPHPFTGFDEQDNLPMSDLSKSKPLHVVNMALNLVKGENLAWQQRKAASFTATRWHTGGCRVGYRASDLYGGAYRSGKTGISLGTAITISGAAASPNMGYNSSTLLTVVMTLFNARLGWWLGNPKAKPDVWLRPGPRWGVRPFADEAFGLTTDTNAWMYLSDGGHFDNLGLYEMVLRRCHTIVVSDAGADPDFSYGDLGNAVRKIRVDLGIPIELATDCMPTSPVEEGGLRERLHFGIAHIIYSAVDPGAPNGILLYIKPCLTGDEPPDVAQYAATDSRFPHQPTADQFFDEAQFESYRRLGLHTVDAICGAPKQTSQSPADPVDLAGLITKASGMLKRCSGAAAAAQG